MYLDANNLYGWTMSQKLPVNSFKWDENIHKFNEDFIKNYDEDNTKGYFLEVDVEYSKNLFNDDSDFQFLPERKKITKFNKFFVPYKIKKTYTSVHCAHKSFRTGIKSWINTKNIDKVTKFNQEAWLKPYIDVNTKLRTEAKN